MRATPGHMLRRSTLSDIPPPNSPFSTCRWSIYHTDEPLDATEKFDLLECPQRDIGRWGSGW